MPELIILRLLHFAASLGAFGILAFALCLPRPIAVEGAPHRDIRGRLRRWALTCAAAALATWLPWLPVQTTSMSGLPRAEGWTWPVIATVLGETDFGSIWIGRAVLLVVLTLLLWRMRVLRADGRLYAVSAILASSPLVLLAWVGHANRETGFAGALHLTGDALHLLGAGIWLGGLPPLWAILRMHGDDATARLADSGEALRRFSDLAVAGVGALVAGAAVNAWFMLPGPGDLAASSYGRMIAVKVVFLAAMLGLAAHNRLILVPRLYRVVGRDEATVAILRRNIMLELALGAGVLAIVSVLGITSP